MAGGQVLVDYVKETLVTNVAILRLKFVYEGKVYNLGVVGDMAHGDGHSSTSTEWSVEIAEWFKNLMIAIAVLGGFILVLVALHLLGWLKPVLEWLWSVIKKVVNFLWEVITAPFVFIKSIFKKE